MSSVAQKAASKKRPSQNSQSSFFKKRAQTKLNVGKPNDKYEVQADKAADQVVANKTVSSSDAFFNPSPNIQKNGQSEEIQQKPVVERITPGIQLKVDEDISSNQSDELQKMDEEVQEKQEEEIQEKQEEEIQEKQDEEIQEQTDEELQEKPESQADEEVQTQLDEPNGEETQLKTEEPKTVSVQLSVEEEVQEKSEEEVQEKTEEDLQEKAFEFQPKLDEQPEVKAEEVQTKTEPAAPIIEPIQQQEQIAQSKTEIKTPPVLQPKMDDEVQEKQDEEIQEQAEEEKELQMKGAPEGPPNSTSNFESHLQSSKGGGAPLPDGTKNEMESSFGADFSKVRIHTDTRAVTMNQELGAQAFATGNNIYFNEGKFDPTSMGGKHLLAHELTHTIQQGASPQGSAIQAKELLQAFGFMDLVPDWIINGARNIPGYVMFTVVAGYDPLLGQNVERNAVNLLHGLMGMVPFGNIIFEKLQAFGIIDQVFDWVNGKLGELGLTTQSILDMMEEAWDELSFPYTDALSVVAEKFLELFRRVTSFAGGLIEQIMTWVKEALINFAEPFLAENKAWSLIKKIIRYDPLRDEEVNAPTVEILEDFLLLIGKETELEQMREKGTLQKTADWLDTQYGTFTSLLQELRSLITSVWNAVQPSSLGGINDAISGLAGQIGSFLQRVWDFALEVAAKVLDLVKESLLGYLSEQAQGVRGYSLLRVIIGKDPFTNEVIERNVPNLIRGFMSLMSGGEEQYAQMVETGAIARIVGEIDAAVETLNMTPGAIIQMFVDLWNSFTINDLLNPIDAFMRIIDAFGEQLGRLVSFVAEIIRIVIVGVLEIMNFPFDLIGNIITRSMEAIEDIKNDPIGFLKNILRAIKQGFIQFFENILTHLVGGITGWLMSELEDANVPTLTDFSLQGVIAWVLEVLNISMDAIWEKLAEHPRIGPERVAQMRGAIDTLQGIWTFIQDVRERGVVAIWEKIQEQLSNLWGAVLSAIQGYIMERIITQVTIKLMGMLDPTGIMAVVNSCIAFYAAVQSFIKYLREMLEIVNSFVNGVADVARGNVSTAANYLENTMGDAMPIVIGFLANQVGLGGIGARIASILESIREMVDEALTWLVNMAVDTGMDMLDSVMEMGANLRDAVLNWWAAEKEFTTDSGEHHRLYFEGSGENSVLTIASIPTAFTRFINGLEVAEDQADQKTAALDVAREIDQVKSRPVTGDTEEQREENQQTKRDSLEELLDTLSDLVIPLLALSESGDLPLSRFFTSEGSNFGSQVGLSMEATLLTSVGPSGTPPTSAAHTLYDTLKQRKNGSSNYYIRGHLLNHNVHGPGTWDNMTPLSGSGNGLHEREAESHVKTAVDNGRIVYYKVTPDDYIGALPTDGITDEVVLEVRRAEASVPKKLKIEGYFLKKEGENYVEDTDAGPLFPRGKSFDIVNHVDEDPANYRTDSTAIPRNIVLSNSELTTAQIRLAVPTLNAGDSESILAALRALNWSISGYDAIGSKWKEEVPEDAADALVQKGIIDQKINSLRNSNYVRLNSAN